MRAVEILLGILETPDDPRRPSATLPQARLAAAEGLAARDLGAPDRARVIAAIAQIARDTTLPLHRVRACAMLLQMGVDEIPAKVAP